MGDAADHLIEQGLDEWWTHQNGQCDGWCPYCEEELQKAAPRKRKRKRRKAP